MIKHWAGLLMSISLSVFLTSCRLNGTQIEVPWWLIAIPIMIYLPSVFLLTGKAIAAKKHICENCFSTFYPKWWKAAITWHTNGTGIFKCPHCGKKGPCHIVDE